MEISKQKIDKLRGDLKAYKFHLNSHCLEVKNRIDLHTERLIKELNEAREDLFSRVDNYEQESLKCFQTVFSSHEFLSDLERAELTLNQSPDVEKLNQLVKELNENEIYLQKMTFKNNRMLDFEPVMFKMRPGQNLLGNIIEKPVQDENVLERETELRGQNFQFDINELIPGEFKSDRIQFRLLPLSENYVFWALQANSTFKLAIIAADFKYCFHIKSFIYNHEAKREYKLTVRVNEKDEIAVLLGDNKNKFNQLFIMDSELNLLHETVFSEKVTDFAFTSRHLIALELGVDTKLIKFYTTDLIRAGVIDLSNEIIMSDRIPNANWKEKVNIFSYESGSLLIRFFYENRYIWIQYDRELLNILNHVEFVLEFVYSFIDSKSPMTGTFCFYNETIGKISYMDCNRLSMLLRMGEPARVGFVYEQDLDGYYELPYFEWTDMPMLHWNDKHFYHVRPEYPLYSVYKKPVNFLNKD